MAATEFLHLNTDVTGSIPLKVSIQPGGESGMDPQLELRDDTPAHLHRGSIVGMYKLSLLREAARANATLSLRQKQSGFSEVEIGKLSLRGIMTCIEYAMERQIDHLLTRITMLEEIEPIAVVEINGGLINKIQSNAPMRVIVLDEDIDGADDKQVAEVLGQNFYVHDAIITSVGEEARIEVNAYANAVDEFHGAAVQAAVPQER